MGTTGRRDFLRALLGGVALLGAGRATGARADMRRPGNAGKGSFKISCESHGGVFVDSPKDGLTICVWVDGSKTVCDATGDDCINYPPPPPKPRVTGGAANPFGGFGGAATADLVETAAPAPDDAGGSGRAKGRHRSGGRRTG